MALIKAKMLSLADKLYGTGSKKERKLEAEEPKKAKKRK